MINNELIRFLLLHTCQSFLKKKCVYLITDPFVFTHMVRR